MHGLDDANTLGGLRKSGVRRGVTDPFGYELAVLPDDVPTLVRSAGGWLCDRVRAGWQVKVFVTEGADLRPLEILGIRTFAVDDYLAAVKGSQVAALAVAAEAVTHDVQLLKFIDRVLDRKAIEFTLWGDDVPVALQGRLDRVQNRMSSAAAAFKKHAIGASSQPCLGQGPLEQFHSASLWYPSDGTDLVPVI